MATYYWYNGSGSWDTIQTGNWSTSATNPRSSFPAPAAPTSADDVVFDSLSGTGVVTLINSPVCRNITATTLSTSLQFNGGTGGSILSVYGSTVNLGANATFFGSKLYLVMYSTSLGNTVTIGNTSLVSNVYYNATGSWTQSASTVDAIEIQNGATVTFSGAITVTSLLSVSSGCTLTTGAFTHSITSTTGGSPTVSFSGTVNLTNTTLNIQTDVLYPNGGYFYVFSGVSLTVTGSTINIGSAATISPVNITNSGAGAVSLNTVNLTGIDIEISGSDFTFSALTINGGTNVNASASLDSFAVTNSLTIQGNSIAPNRLFVSPILFGGISDFISSKTITLSGAGAKTFRWIDVQDITLNVIGGATPTFTSIGDCFGNTGFTLTPAVTRFAVSGGVSKNFSSTTLWSASSGGATGATVPLPQDTVIFDSNANAEVVFDMPRIGKDVTFNTGVGFVTNISSVGTVGIFGTPNAEALNKLTSVSLESRSSILIPACTINRLYLGGKGGIYTSSGPLGVSQFYPIHGSYYSSGYTITVFSIYITAGNSAASWYASTSIINCTLEFIFYTVGTTSFSSSTIDFGPLLGSYSLEAYSGTTFGTVIFSSNGSSESYLSISSGLTITKLVNSGTAPKRFRFSTSGTTTIGTLEISGSSSAPVLFSPATISSGALAATISLTNSVTTSFVAFCLITKTGAGTINATGVANLGRNTGITFSSTLYGICYTGFVGSPTSGSFTVPSDFSGSSMLVTVGGGGGGAKRSSTTGTAGGGGAGALGVSSNLPISPGQTIYFSAGRGGVGGFNSSGQSGLTGGDSWINITSNFAPSTSSEGASAAGGNPALLNSTSPGTGGTSAIGLITASGGSGGSGVIATTAGSGGGGSAPRLFTTVLTGYAGRAGASGNSGGGGGGGYGGTGGLASTTTGGLGGLNSLGAQASGGTAGNPGSAGTSGGGGGGGGGATTGTAGAGGVGVVAPDFIYTRLNGVSSTGTIGPGGGGGGGGTATSTGTGGAGGDNQASYGGAGGGGGGRGGTVATNGNGGNGSGGFVLFVYTVSTTTPKSQGSIIG